MRPSGPATTAGVIAIGNLQAQIAACRSGPGASVADRATIIDMLLLRGHLLGCIADTEEAAALAEQLVREAPDCAQAYLARTRTRGALHCFAAAFDDLDHAERLGLDPHSTRHERAALFEAVGRYDDAMDLRRDLASPSPTFHSIAGLASLYAAREEFDEAERHFTESRRRYRGVSPFPIAVLDYQRGHMWLRAGELSRARTWFLEALTRLPAYVPAQGHLAATEAASGDQAAAVDRLRRAVSVSDDPEYAVQLARLLADLGQLDESRSWRDNAASRYTELLARHPAAFADHAAELWLWQNNDPVHALQMATLNFEVRPTKRAGELLNRARRAASHHRNSPQGWSPA